MSRRLRWKPLAITAAAVLCIYLPIITLDSDSGAILYWLAVLLFTFGCLVVAFTFTFTRKWRDALTLTGIAVVCVSMSVAFFSRSYFLRVSYRWAFHADLYKGQLLARHASIPSGLSYMQWDGWGFAGSDTFVFLVYDPGDRLKHVTRTGFGVKVEGLPCEVQEIRRLERGWYTAVPFTNEDLLSCNPK